MNKPTEDRVPVIEHGGIRYFAIPELSAAMRIARVAYQERDEAHVELEQLRAELERVQAEAIRLRAIESRARDIRTGTLRGYGTPDAFKAAMYILGQAHGGES